MKILYTGPLTPIGQTCEMRRVTLGRLGHATLPVDYMPHAYAFTPMLRKIQWRLRWGPMLERYNNALFLGLNEGVDLLWVDKGMFVYPEVILTAKRLGVLSVHYSPDNYFLGQNNSRHLSDSLPLFDLVVTTKTANVDRLRGAGVKRVHLSGNAYDPETHYPLSADEQRDDAFKCDVSFVGRWEPEREYWLSRLAEAGVHLSVRGIQWDRSRSRSLRDYVHAEPVLGRDYARAIFSAKINLAFLSRLAADTITQRSVEIPACGGFMLAERTDDHLAHFDEGREAAYFEGFDEMVEKIHYYLSHEDERIAVARAGRERCVRGGYSYDARLSAILDELLR